MNDNWNKYPTGYGKGYTLEPVDPLRAQKLQEWIRKNPEGLNAPRKPGDMMNLQEDDLMQAIRDRMLRGQ